MSKKVVIFDMDGVLFDTVKLVYESFKKVYPDMTEEYSKKLMSGNFHEELLKIPFTQLKHTEEEIQINRLAFSKMKSEAVLFPGIKELLKRLHSSEWTIVINTSAYERNTLPLLKNSDIISYFDYIGTAEISKSKLEKFKIMEKRYNVKGSDMIFVTDTLGDLRESDKAGIPTIAVTWGGHDRSFFECEDHDNLIGIADTVEELEKLIN
ncbi:MAG: superfamily hydrolase [Candidatus Nomurabacteria bacterium]|nr:superfamily hydrolase [Candidatus Nomurabacteria bacterium]